MNPLRSFDGPKVTFYLVFECEPGVWSSVAYWSALAANTRRAGLASKGVLAFVEVA